jgi:NDP-sugar pyrophosphorylase family protein
MLPHTDRRPKFLVPVAGEPFAAYQLRWLSSQGVRHVVIAIAHLGEMVKAYVGDGRVFGLEVAYSSDGEQLLGTGGALRRAIDRHGLKGPVLVVYGDSYLSVDLTAVVARYAESRLPALMVVYENHNELDASNADFDGRIVRYEKGRADPVASGLHFIDYGLSIFDAATIVERVPRGASVDLSAVQTALSRDYQLAGYQAAERFFEIGSPSGLADLEQYLCEQG